jgi:hypothetical protein
MKPSNTMKTILSFTASLLLLHGAICAAAEGFPQSAAIPRTVPELWAGYAEFDQATPLEAEILKTWEQDGRVCRIVRYQVGVFKGAPARVAAFYAFPKGAKKLPGLLHLHGGGQSASTTWPGTGATCPTNGCGSASPRT